MGMTDLEQNPDGQIQLAIVQIVSTVRLTVRMKVRLDAHFRGHDGPRRRFALAIVIPAQAGIQQLLSGQAARLEACRSALRKINLTHQGRLQGLPCVGFFEVGISVEAGFVKAQEQRRLL